MVQRSSLASYVNRQNARSLALLWEPCALAMERAFYGRGIARTLDGQEIGCVAASMLRALRQAERQGKDVKHKGDLPDLLWLCRFVFIFALWRALEVSSKRYHLLSTHADSVVGSFEACLPSLEASKRLAPGVLRLDPVGRAVSREGGSCMLISSLLSCHKTGCPKWIALINGRKD